MTSCACVCPCICQISHVWPTGSVMVMALHLRSRGGGFDQGQVVGVHTPVSLSPSSSVYRPSKVNTMSPRPRPTSVPSGILIHPAVWPQQTWTLVDWGGGMSACCTACPIICIRRNGRLQSVPRHSSLTCSTPSALQVTVGKALHKSCVYLGLL